MKKAIIAILYSIISVFWLFFSALCISVLWLTGPGTNDWEEDAMFIPIGIIMLIIWMISFIALVFSFKNKKKTTDANSDMS